MEQALGYDALMHEVCVGKGYCGGVVDGKLLHVDMFIPESGPVTADQFIDWLFNAEGITDTAAPGRLQDHRAALRAAFVRHMGSDLVDAGALKWSVRQPPS